MWGKEESSSEMTNGTHDDPADVNRKITSQLAIMKGMISVINDTLIRMFKKSDFLVTKNTNTKF